MYRMNKKCEILVMIVKEVFVFFFKNKKKYLEILEKLKII